jgi:hypothetical protein
MSKKSIVKKIKYMLRFISDKRYVKIYYRLKMHKKLNLKEPKTYSEKLNWLKLNDHNPLYTKLVDKYEVKDYIKNEIGEEYVIPTYGIYNNVDEIDLDKLPNQFVLKCTHDSEGIVICKDKSKLDWKAAKKKLKQCLKYNFYYIGREWPYKNVKPRIIVEKYMEDKIAHELIDYKVLCFDGVPKIIFTCTDRYTDGLKVTWFDLNWHKLPFERHYPASNKKIAKPKKFDEMIKFSEKLSKNIPFVRMDWYEINGDLYFGEYTFYPGSGMEEFTPEEWDYKLGELIKLPSKKER